MHLKRYVNNFKWHQAQLTGKVGFVKPNCRFGTVSSFDCDLFAPPVLLNFMLQNEKQDEEF